ncbi:hybrid PKS-NRPS biosynthetic cluster [Penicillium macrosclerotiorum]|uniref:hybrid PKS-NRPS biosynthetic cluster n=1 Tax=Penicillium macrosclerotiorum TaxID=303699 RepID=UPI002549245E|nr:hybrid PKS-NRPS biosynthetic cluster [Penicillium macrosclerotiorum]KAJ5692060.1 hybrid PKS-NRPS biosynthetic cluster [Penicillium macrosclerotiorum]
MTVSSPEPIAIVGSACRFPGGADSPSNLWKLLRAPRDVSKEITPDRFDLRGFYHPDGAHHGTTNVRQSYLLEEDLWEFDATFFNISANEADSIDPQQRLLLETVYEALESGGHTIESLNGSDTAVYVGNMAVDYHDILLRDLNSLPTYFATGTARSIMANRISYFFNWHGPSVMMDTACSSSLIALHQGVQSLRTGESKVAVACGAELMLGPEIYVAESKMNLLSPTSRSRMWDVDADGYARGDGIATVILKRLSDAIADGDHIECLIRGTATNQDGRSTGLTVPSSEAQAALIQQTYARAGLDINEPRDRPQYFEAHGTGTKVGDPREAAAIQLCFGQRDVSDPLFVGSIKTIIGHTEGTAGLAGVIKGSLAIQKGEIPPNLLFNRLNPSIEPYYRGLHVPTSVKTWPALPEGVPRRVSVNSFGFGGSNAHAILEQYLPPTGGSTSVNLNVVPVTPFTFSAVSEGSLVALLESFSAFLKTRQDLNLPDLGWTLQSRRSQFAVKTALSALTIDGLITKIDQQLAAVKANPGSTVGIRSSPAPVRVLGVFTGQGAQWASMGAQLIRSVPMVREKIHDLDRSLATLPPSDRPDWSIEEELLAGPENSRILQAALSQPLCTVIQIIIVELLRAAGITFEAVVGHSSGEIAAAYAAGFFSAHDAVRIAYYRGLHAHLACDPSGQKGAMLAVGTSWEDAQDLIDLPFFRGRLQIAAHNSAASVTLSGNADAVVHAKKVFDEEKKFARLLKVDTAYHSHHMLQCGDAYIQSLRKCGIEVNKDRDPSCTWYSSVTAGEVMQPADELRDIYWRDNMTNAVLFAEAVKNAAGDQLTIALEVGPHPALKGPATQNISDVRSALPYTGILNRGSNDVEAFSDALGFIWTSLGHGSVDFEACRKALAGDASPSLLVGLPSYPWSRARTHRHEARISRKMRAIVEPVHELLGVPSAANTERDRRWTNVLKASEITWLNGHQLQGQTVFPAAGYIATAFEAAKSVAGERSVTLFELHNLIIRKAIAFEDTGNFAVETLVTLTAITSISHAGTDQEQTAEFSYYACPNTGTDEMDLVASGQVRIAFGAFSPTTLLSKPLEDSTMVEVDADRFYSSLLELGYGYTGPFRGLSAPKRRFEQCSGLVSSYPYADADSAFLVHPSTLDIAFQAALLAHSAPGDERLWSIHVPTSIRTIRINPTLCASVAAAGAKLPISIVLHEPESVAIRGSAEIFSADGRETLIQVDDLVMVPFAPATEADDRRLFSYTKWDVAAPNGSSITNDEYPSDYEIALAGLCERVSYYYLRRWKSEITENEWENGQPHHRALRNFMEHNLSSVLSGRHPYIKKEWATDTEQDVKTLLAEYPDSVDLKLISAVGEHIPAVVRGETTVLEHMLRDNMLDDFYKKGVGFAKYNSFMAQMMQQITHRYPHMNILEIGAGTGGATKAVLDAIGKTYSSYTYTDVSAGFFQHAADLFRAHNDKMTFKVFDVEKSPVSQGFNVHSYDIIIASNVLHATISLHQTLENTRRLLKPGGYLMLLEATNNWPIRFSNIMGGLPGWWLGVDDGRKLAPTIAPGAWHTALRKAGFAGVDTITPEINGLAWPFSIIAAQAVNDQVNFLRRPLASPTPPVYIDELVILGGTSLVTSRISEQVSEQLSRFCGQVTILEDLPTDADRVSPMSTFINLVDLDYPIFKDLTAERMDSIKRLFRLSRRVLWVTSGAQGENPYHMASISFGRVISHEMPHIALNHLDLARLDDDVPKVISEYLLRQTALEAWNSAGETAHQLLWSNEPEFFFEGGQWKVARLLANAEYNNRLNTSRRAVTQKLSLAKSKVFVSQSTATLPPLLQEDTLPVAPKENQSQVRVLYSSLAALKVTSDAFLYLSIGRNTSNNDAVVALSLTNSSEVTPVVSVAVNNERTSTSGLLVAVTSELLATSAIQAVPSGSHLLVHASRQNRSFTAALVRQAAVKKVRATFISVEDTEDNTWISLNRGLPEYVVRRLLPPRVTHFLDVVTAEVGDIFSDKILAALPSLCKRVDLSTLLAHQPQLLSHDHAAILTALKDAIRSAKDVTLVDSHTRVITLSHLTSTSKPHPPTTVLDWISDETVKVAVRPLDAERLFSADKTYLLVGLSGQIGKSLCEWMVRNGAGYVILTSRRPNVDTKWLETFKGTDATVKFLPLDITDKSSLEQAVHEIRSSCPPIAGVANGAMVLHDTLFEDMSFSMMHEAIVPKIEGSNNLDEAFYNDNLDFFIMFSSLACLVGNPGQCNYAAACGYMTSLARQRRLRGRAGSAFDIGRVAGVGYVERAGQVVVDQLRKYGYMAISEAEFHQMFAETIRAGHPEYKLIPVVTTGIRTIRSDEEIKGPWFDNPLFSHCIVEVQGVDSKHDDKKASLPVIEQVANAASLDDALNVLKDCFSAKLQAILQISDEAMDHGASLTELGIDSLVAVEVRSWFLKEVKVDFPVLKLLGGGSLSEICEQTLGKLPEEIRAKIGAKPSIPTPKPQPKAAVSSTASADTPPTGTSSPDAQSVVDSTTSAPSEESLKSTEKGTSSPPLTQRALTFLKSEQISFAQSRFWFLGHFLQDPTTFNVAFYYRVTGSMRVDALDRAVRIVASRHEGLRTCFVPHENEADLASQRVIVQLTLELEHWNIDKLEDVAVEYTKLKAHVFNLERGELMRVILLTLSPNVHFLLFNYHHILMDGFSYQVFLAELEKAYKGLPLGPPPRQFPDYSRAQRQEFENGGMVDELKFWQGIFPDEPPVLPLLPIAHGGSRVPMHRFDIHQVETRLDPELTSRVKAAARAQKATAFHFHLAAFKLMLFRFTTVQDLTIGIADANRNDSDVMESIGFFLNLLPLRFHRKSGQRFADAITEARNTTYAALSNSRLPFDVLLTELNVPRSSTHSPLFQAFFDYRPGSQDKHPWGDCQFEVQEMHPGRTAYDITLDVTESATGALVTIRAQKSLYDLTAANLLLDTYLNLLDVLTGDITLFLENTPLFSNQQLTRALELGRGPNLVSTWPETLPHRIDQVAKGRPNAIALKDDSGKDMSYTDMINRVEAIGEILGNCGIQPGARVLVFQQATADWICSMLAIMRIGCVYVPLDLRNPLPRLATVAVDCDASAILTDSSTTQDVPQLNVPNARIIDVSRLGPRPSAPVSNSARSDSVAAILYTSGSTGTPKGIVVMHSGLRNEIEGYTKTWGLGAECVLQQSSFTFNHSSDQIYTGLVNGGTVYIVPWSKRGDPLEITKLVRQQGITYTKATPSEYSLWMQFGAENLRQASSWKFAFGGGEPLAAAVTSQFNKLDLPRLRFFNSYGPTEISISSHKMEINYREQPGEGRIPCGYSLPNYVTYVLDEQLKPVPAGIPGEIYIGGAGVSLGYLNNKKLTDMHFIHNPFATPDHVSAGWTRMYRTGDIGHLQEDGAMVFHSRIAGDAQVKIRGLRIELSDIESNIIRESAGALGDAVVTLRGSDPEFLVVHVVFSPHHEVTDEEGFLQSLLSHLPLPQYMIPVLAIPLEKFPLTNHSKVDRKSIQSLPLPERKMTTEDEEELTQTMEQLKRVWLDVLRNQELGFNIVPSTSFFSVGGNSLLVIRLQSRIRDVFDVAVRLLDLLDANTLRGMAQHIEEAARVQKIDWEEETALSDYKLPVRASLPPIQKEKRVVLVTGTTGFLAKYVLPELIANAGVSRIHCVAVRNKGSESPRKLPVSSSKIVIHHGDLAAPQLGLTESGFEVLSREVDAILHMGAVRSFWDNYHSLRPSNVLPTKELVRLAAPRRIPIHYISTAGVFPRDARPVAVSVAGNFPPTDGTDGYVATRWASEQILERATACLGIPTQVHRFIPPSADVSPVSNGDHLDELIRYIEISGKLPDFSSWDGHFHMIPAKVAARGLTDALVNESNEEELSTRYAHHESPIEIDVAAMRLYIEKYSGNSSLERIPGLRWLGLIKSLGFAYFMTSQDVRAKTRGGAAFESRR